MKSLGQLAYEAWIAALTARTDHISGKVRAGLRMDFDELCVEIQEAWEAAADAITKTVQ